MTTDKLCQGLAVHAQCMTFHGIIAFSEGWFVLGQSDQTRRTLSAYFISAKLNRLVKILGCDTMCDGTLAALHQLHRHCCRLTRHASLTMSHMTAEIAISCPKQMGNCVNTVHNSLKGSRATAIEKVRTSHY